MKESKQFGELFNFLPKSKIKAGEGTLEGKYPFYTSSNVLSKFHDDYTYEGDSLVFGTGGSASVHFQDGKFASSTDCFVVQPSTKSVLAKYVYYFLFSNMHILERGFKGAGLKHISKGYIQNVQIPIPYPDNPSKSLSEQQRIAEILDQANEIYKKSQRAIRKLNSLIPAIFHDMFGDPVANTKGWDKKELGDITNLITDGKHGDCRDEIGSGYFFISAKDIHDGIIDYSNARQIIKVDFEEVHRRTDLTPGDLVVVNTGATIGKMAIALDDERTVKTTFQKSVAVVKPQKKHVMSIFLKSLFELNLRDLVKASSGSAQKNLLLSQMRRIKIVLPPLELQQEFSKKIKEVQELKAKYEQSTAKANVLFNSLVQRAFNGEL